MLASLRCCLSFPGEREMNASNIGKNTIDP